MENLPLDNGLPALFALSFLAATIGNFLGGCTTYGIGCLGSTFVMNKSLRISDQETGKARAIYNRYGSWSLLFSWVPIIGDPLWLWQVLSNCTSSFSPSLFYAENWSAIGCWPN